MKTPEELIKGAVDMHLHSGPGLIPRGYDHIEVAKAAREAGMRAIVIKDQHLPSANVCTLLQRYFDESGGDFRIFGGLVLGNPVGGVNPSAVEAALGFGTKVIWMPVSSAKYGRERMAYMREHFPEYRSGIPKAKKALKYDPPLSILDSDGKLLPEIGPICHMIAEADAVLATGHLSKEETRELLDEAVKQGCKKVVITHAEFFKDYSIEEMREFQKAGFYVEHILATLYSGKQTYDGLYELIRGHGCEKTIISSDLGQVGRPIPSDGILTFIDEMQKRGLSEEDILRITGSNPRSLLDLDQ